MGNALQGQHGLVKLQSTAWLSAAMFQHVALTCIYCWSAHSFVSHILLPTVKALLDNMPARAYMQQSPHAAGAGWPAVNPEISLSPR